ncbi:MAG: AbrB family transcriptional regulator [Actinobacteria bacterium]|nr:AbrB family transcriptional regulator [Actinomycetota bacterium]
MSTPKPGACATQECCALEAVVSVDERGQLVLPKDLRMRAGIGPGERMALVSYRGSDGSICCITLLKADAVSGAVRSVIPTALGGTE